MRGRREAVLSRLALRLEGRHGAPTGWEVAALCPARKVGPTSRRCAAWASAARPLAASLSSTRRSGSKVPPRRSQTEKKAPNSEGRQTAEAAVKDKVQREIIGALAKQRQSNIMAYRGDKPAEMMRCLQDMEQHYRGALEEKVWEMFEMREANEALAKSVSDTQIARAKEIAIAKAREEEWNRHEARMHEAEETALRLQTRVRALLTLRSLRRVHAEAA